MNSRLKKTMIISILIVIVLFVIVLIIGMISGRSLSYEKVEEKMKEAAYEYYNAHPKKLPQNEDGETKIDVSTLIEKKYMKSIDKYLKDEKTCKGEVFVTLRNGDYIYTPYLYCENYNTKILVNYIKEKEQIIENINAGEDGLYNYGDKLIYRGENVNNYVFFNDELWRILRIDENNNIRMLQVEGLGEIIWDDRYNADAGKVVGYNKFEKSRMKEVFEKIRDGYYADVLSDNAKQYLVSDYLCLDAKNELSFNQNGIISCNTKSQNKYPFTFVDISEYFIASTDPNCNSFNNISCRNYNYMNYYGGYWSMNASDKNSYQLYYVSGGAYTTNVDEKKNTRLVVTITKNSLYAGGDGTKENPYKIK